MKSLLPGQRKADSAFVALWAGLVAALGVLALGEVLDTTMTGSWYLIILVGSVAAFVIGSVIRLRFPRHEVTRRERIWSLTLAALFLAVGLAAIALMIAWWHGSEAAVPPAATALGGTCFVALIAAAVLLYRSGGRADR